MQGWISLHRSMLEWEWYDDINVCRFFVHCLLRANHRDKTWKGITINRGEFISSLDKIARETGLSVSQIRTCLKKLKSTGEIASKSHTQHTVFIIVNYDKYQSDDKPYGKPVANESQTNDKRIATNNNDNNENNENNVNKKTKAKALDFSSWPNQPSDDVWSDFVKHRKSVKAPISQTVINRMTKPLFEMTNNNWSVDDVLAEICTRGWKSFKPEWLLKDQVENSGFSKVTQKNIQNTMGEW